MGVRKAQMFVFECDGNDCDEAEYSEVDEVPIGWYTGNTIHHHAGGGDGGSWLACSIGCVEDAVRVTTSTT